MAGERAGKDASSRLAGLMGGKRAVGANGTLWRPRVSYPGMPLAPSACLGGRE